MRRDRSSPTPAVGATIMVDERGVAETLFPPASTPAGTQYYLMLLLGFLFVSPMIAPSSAPPPQLPAPLLVV